MNASSDLNLNDGFQSKQSQEGSNSVFRLAGLQSTSTLCIVSAAVSIARCHVTTSVSPEGGL